MYSLNDYHFDLPEELIAQLPVEKRDRSRLMLVDRETGKWTHKRFRDIGGELQPGDVLVLTKAIGTGTLFAADMRSKAKGRWIDHALQTMVLSNQQAAEYLQQHGATACTDLTGFGLLGHLVEMTRASSVDACLYMDALPILDGARETVAAGILSSLQPQNLRLRRALQDLESASQHSVYPLLFDPQTAGGLLAGIPQENAEGCIETLRHGGYPDASIIGVVEATTDQLAPIRIQN